MLSKVLTINPKPYFTNFQRLCSELIERPSLHLWSMHGNKPHWPDLTFNIIILSTHIFAQLTTNIIPSQPVKLHIVYVPTQNIIFLLYFNIYRFLWRRKVKWKISLPQRNILLFMYRKWFLPNFNFGNQNMKQVGIENMVLIWT